nr:hypothetical protein HAGR004_26600 [Bdellovibrio sp. HAGR004]
MSCSVRFTDKFTQKTLFIIGLFFLLAANTGCTLDADIKDLTLKAIPDSPSIPMMHEFGVSGVLKISGSNKVNMNPRFLNTQSDGKLIVGQFYFQSLYDLSKPLLFRLNQNGSLDTTYGNSGYFELPKTVNSNGIADMQTSNDGTYILYTNTALDGFSVLKIAPTGQIDTSFGNAGVFNHTESGNTLYGRKLAITASGQILVASYRFDVQYKSTTFLINTNGTLEPNHGTGGMNILANSGSPENPVGILYISDTEIYLLNHVQAADRVKLRKFNVSGVEDGSFATAYPSTAAVDTIRWIELKKINNDRLVIFGNTATAGGSTQRDQGLLVVCNLDGTPDTGFNATGTLMFTDGSLSYGVLDVRGVIDGSANKDIQIARTETQRQPSPYDKLRTFTKVLLSQYNYNGTLDATHGTGGTITYNGTDNLNILKFQPDDSVVATGRGSALAPLYYSAIVRKFTSSMSPDAAFADTGTHESIFDSATDNGKPEIQYKIDNNTFLYTGRFEARSAKIFIAKTDKSGVIQTQFGDNGYIRDVFENGYEEILTLKHLADGSIMVCGESTGTKFSIAKFRADGSRDLGFGLNGVYSETINNGSTAYPWFCAFNDNGESVGILNNGNNIITAKVLADGTRDLTFGVAGLNVITIPPGSVYDLITMKQADDGRTVIAGLSYDGSMDQAQFLLMIAPDGYVDSNFSGDGYVELRIDTDSDHATMGLEFAPDGRLYTVFDAYEMPSWDPIIYINCYKPDGTLDTSFGSGTGYIHTTTDFWIDTNIWGGDALTIDSQGNLYVFGLDYSQNLVMKSWKSDGTENSNFGTNGIQTMNFPMSQYRSLNDVLWDSNDNSFKILDGTAYRLNRSGELF